MILMFSQTMGNLASIRTLPGDTRAQLAQIKEVFLAHFPNQPFEYFFMDQEYNKQYQADERFQQVFSSLTAFAILIACFGLFGLVSFAVSKRAKEIGIRKVLGASVPELMALLAKSFLSLILLASLISIPITYWVVENWLERYPFRIDLEIWLFVVPAALVVLISWLTIFSQTLQISTRNPIESLRDE
jgi:putative ABC transport system permease protein